MYSKIATEQHNRETDSETRIFNDQTELAKTKTKSIGQLTSTKRLKSRSETNSLKPLAKQRLYTLGAKMFVTIKNSEQRIC